MWMMGYNDGCHDDLTSFNGRKLLPLLPKPISSTTTTNPQFISHYNHQLGVAEQNKLRESNNTPQVVVSSRWNPTPEQLRALEELYRQGTRTPSAEQIQNITAQLRRYGKIEGKNVFYWFQNHKARERQKRRRQMESISEDQDQPRILSEKKELLGTSRTIYDEHITKNWVPSTNCGSSLTAEEYYGISSTQENVAKAGAESSTTENELIQLRPELLQNRRSSFNNIGKNSTWQTTHLSYPPISTNNVTHLINTLPSSTTTPSNRSTTPVSTTIMDQKHQPIKAHDLMNYFITPSSTQSGTFNYFNTSFNTHDDDDEGGDQYLYGGDQSDQTLQLFPIPCGTLSEKDSDEMLSVSKAMNASCISSSTSPPQQFFEFLPLKN